MKQCSRCKEFKDLSLFGNNKTEKDGLMRQCKNCNTERVKQHYAENGHTPDPTRVYRRHGVTQTQYEIMFNKYNGLCHACQTNPANRIDHDHNCCDGSWGCGKCVRGILCHGCNTAFGFLGDSIERVEKLAAYARMVKV